MCTLEESDASPWGHSVSPKERVTWPRTETFANSHYHHIALAEERNVDQWCLKQELPPKLLLDFCFRFYFACCSLWDGVSCNPGYPATHPELGMATNSQSLRLYHPRCRNMKAHHHHELLMHKKHVTKTKMLLLSGAMLYFFTIYSSVVLFGDGAGSGYIAVAGLILWSPGFALNSQWPVSTSQILGLKAYLVLSRFSRNDF